MPARAAALVSLVLLAGCAGGGGGAPAAAAAARPAERWFCPMHPGIVRDQPGACPACHMELQRAEAPEGGGAGDRAGFTLRPGQQQLIGLTTARVERRALERVIRAGGRISYDPDLVMAVEEYRQAAAGGARAERAGADGQRLQLALRRSIAARLRLLGLSDAQIGELAGSTGPPAELLAGLKGGRVWVFIDVFAGDLGLVERGQVIEARTSLAPGQVFTGAVKAVDRTVNPMTRTARARALVQNSGGLLKAEMYLDVRIKAPLGTQLAVPAEAVLDGGERQVAFVLGEDGAIEPRTVTIGPRGEDLLSVLSGLREGEAVVASANFLVDSESRLRAALAGFGGPR